MRKGGVGWGGAESGKTLAPVLPLFGRSVSPLALRSYTRSHCPTTLCLCPSDQPTLAAGFGHSSRGVAPVAIIRLNRCARSPTWPAHRDSSIIAAAR